MATASAPNVQWPAVRKVSASNWVPVHRRLRPLLESALAESRPEMSRPASRRSARVASGAAQPKTEVCGAPLSESLRLTHGPLHRQHVGTGALAGEERR